MNQPAASAATRYHLAVVDQNSKTVRVFDRTATRWNDDAIMWQFEGRTHWWNDDWADLSDVKIRKTAKRGLIALVTASGGAAGIVDIGGKGEKKNSDDDLLWQEEPGGNPHSIERIPYNGTIITASSEGSLHQYSPRSTDDIDDFSKYGEIRSWEFPGAHGVLWDPPTKSKPGVLWALGDGRLYGYTVEGSGWQTRLNRWRTEEFEHPGAQMGHDLQPDYTQPGNLLLTDSKGVYTYDVDKAKFTTISHRKRVKSIARHASGEYVWIVGSPSNHEMGTRVSMGSTPGNATDERGWDDAQFYKARIFSPAYE